MENEEKTIRSEISEIKEAVKILAAASTDRMNEIDGKIHKQFKKASDKMSNHIETIETERRKKMMEVKYIGVEFDPIGVKQGQDEVNAALKVGFEPIRDFETPKGIVMVLGLWGDRDVQTKTRTERRL